jgi:tetratricopeptide (TPR) repeat protein
LGAFVIASAFLRSMSGFRSPLDAYREDLSRAPGRARLGADDEYWIILATGMRRIAQAPARSRRPAARRLSTALAALARQPESVGASSSETVSTERLTEQKAGSDTGRPAAVAAAFARFPEADAASALVTHVRGVAADAEEAGAIVLAREMLTDLGELAGHAPALDRGLVLIQLARTARTLGDLDSARDLLSAAGELGRASSTPELEVREAAAKAVLARIRGNYPESRVLFEAALASALPLRLTDIIGASHHGLMIVTSEAGDFDDALRHGWQALSAARSHRVREAEMLINLAQLCAKAGYDAAALGGFSAALARASLPRLRLPALAGLAEAASRVGDAARVSIAEHAIAAEASESFPFETARAWYSLARAHRALGNRAAADAAAEKAVVITRAHGFFEVLHRLEQEAVAKPAPLSVSGMEVVKTLESWTDDPTGHCALSG